MSAILAGFIAALTVGILQVAGVDVSLTLALLIGALVACVVILIEDAS